MQGAIQTRRERRRMVAQPINWFCTLCPEGLPPVLPPHMLLKVPKVSLSICVRQG